jgi:hypothetical protein
MTTEACGVVVALTRALAAARAERDAWRRVANAALHHAHKLHVELERLRATHARLRDEFRATRRAA